MRLLLVTGTSKAKITQQGHWPSFQVILFLFKIPQFLLLKEDFRQPEIVLVFFPIRVFVYFFCHYWLSE